MGFEIDADEFERNLVEALEEETGLRFGEENEIPFTELFPEEFMRLYTEFDSMDAFLNASQWEVETQEDFREIPDEPFDEYVDEHTDFPNWEVMHQTASQRFLERRLS
jgi:hypothetical protein